MGGSGSKKSEPTYSHTTVSALSFVVAGALVAGKSLSSVSAQRRRSSLTACGAVVEESCVHCEKDRCSSEASELASGRLVLVASAQRLIENGIPDAVDDWKDWALHSLPPP